MNISSGAAGGSTVLENNYSEELAQEDMSAAPTPKTVAGRLRVDVPLSSTQVRVVFDPASIERARRMEQLNQAIRLGYRPPKSSTR